jgi:hypothetical protein
MHSRAIEQKKSSLVLSALQREVLAGLLLGDAHLETQNNGRTYRIKLEYSVKQRKYAGHLYGLFEEWILTPPQEKHDGSHNNIWFQTLSHSAFRYYAHQFYTKGVKSVPVNVHRFLTARSIAYWFMDDGSMKSRESKGVLLNTQCFGRNDVQRLIAVLRTRFDLEANERRQREGYQIYISGRSFERFKSLVGPHIHPSMLYKIPVDRIT